MGEGEGCVDVDECLEQDVCTSQQFCINNDGSYSCLSKLQNVNLLISYIVLKFPYLQVVIHHVQIVMVMEMICAIIVLQDTS